MLLAAASVLGLLSVAWGSTFKVLYSFLGVHTFSGPDVANPYSGLVADSSGNLYGVTYAGGAYGYGVVYEITP
jgi:uncharacterized repeat protein (TIGR03803 family)